MITPGTILVCDLGHNPNRYYEEQGRRPCVVVSSELHNQVNRTVIVVPLTKQLNKDYWHEHYRFQGINIIGESVAMCEHIREVDKERCGTFIGRATDEDLKNILTVVKEIALA